MNVQPTTSLRSTQHNVTQKQLKRILLEKIREDRDIEGIINIINSNKKLLKLKHRTYGGTLLHHTAYLGSINSFKLLHEKYGFSLTDKDLSLLTPLHVACAELYGGNDIESSQKILTKLLKEKYKNKSDKNINSITLSMLRKHNYQLKKSLPIKLSCDRNILENTAENDDEGWITENEDDKKYNALFKSIEEENYFKIISYYIDRFDIEHLYSLEDYDGQNIIDYSERFHIMGTNITQTKDLV